jgi:hypothetical protein
MIHVDVKKLGYVLDGDGGRCARRDKAAATGHAHLQP